MLSAIREIGKLTEKEPTKIETRMDGKILAIELDTNTYRFTGIKIEDFDSQKANDYLFKQRASKGNVPSPFCPLTEPQKTYKKIEGWLKQCSKVSDDLIIKNITKTITKNKNAILEKIEEKTRDFSKKDRKFLTVKINGRYLGEYEIFKKCLERSADIKRKKSASCGMCSICGSYKEVSARTEVFKFDSFDKPGFISGGFDSTLTWKNFPVCLECKKYLEVGRKFIENNLNFTFYGLSYYLIPRLLVGNALEDTIGILSDTKKIVSLKERTKKRITNDEKEILDGLSEEKDVLTLNFLFLQKQQSAERILLLIEDVLPSRIRDIFKAKDHVDRVFNNNSDKGFTFANIRTFFSRSSEGKRENDLNKYFLEIVDSVFRGRRLDFAFLVKFYMATIRKEFISDRDFRQRVKDSLMATMFFEKLGLIFFEEEEMEENIFDVVFKKFGKSFGDPAKRGIFLLGTLTQLLLEKQYSSRNSKPFMKKLKGLKMDEKDIKSLLPEVQNKLEEYDSFDKGKKLIASEISKYLLEAGEGWKMSVDVINFYFACGMNLADEIKNIVYPKNKEKEE